MLKKLCILFCMVFILCSCQAEETEADISDTTVETTTAEETTALELQGLLTRQRIREGYTLIDFPDGEFLEMFGDADYAIYKKFDRAMTLEDFGVLGWYMLRDEIYELLGEPSGLVNDTRPIPYYELQDGTYVVLCVDANSKNSCLTYYYHINQNGKILFQKGDLPWISTEEVEKGYTLIDFPNGRFLELLPDADFATYKKMDRTLQIEDFKILEWYRSYEEVCELLGEPSGLLNVSRPIPYYELADGTYMVLYVSVFTDTHPLSYYYQVDAEGELLMWRTSMLSDEEIAEGYVTYPIQNGGWVLPYKEFDRELYLEDFDFITPATHFDEVVALIGEPNGDVGSGFPRPYYNLSDGSRVTLIMREYNGPIIDLIYRDKDGNESRLFDTNE